MNKLVLLLFAFIILLDSGASAQVTYLGAAHGTDQNPSQLVISADNRFAYAIARSEIQAYQRNPANGQLDFLSAISEMPDGTDLYQVVALAISPDGRFIYAEGSNDGFVFSRDSVSGLLAPFQILTENFSPLIIPTSDNNIVVANDGKFIYIIGRTDLYIYEKDSATSLLNLADTIQDINPTPGISKENSIALSHDNTLAYITGGHSISVFARDSETGLLTFKSIITGNNYVNQGLTYSHNSAVSADDRFVYSVSNSNGSGALVVLERDAAADTLSIIQTIPNNIRPGFVNLTRDDRVLCVSSGITFNAGSMLFYERDSLSGKVRPLSSFINSTRFGQKKCIDTGNRYLYSCPAFTDSVFIYRFDLFLDSLLNICSGDSVTLQPWGNYISYSWSTGSSNASVEVSVEGIYFLTAEDENGNFFSDSIGVSVHLPPPVYVGEDLTLYPRQYVLLSPGFGYESYYWNTYDSSYMIMVYNDSLFFGSQMITVTVTDDYHCVNTDTIVVTFLSNPAPVEASEEGDIFIYPNPVFSEAIVQTRHSFENATLAIYNASGQLVRKMGNLYGRTFLVKRYELSNGIYLLRMEDGTNTYVTKFIIYRE